MALMSAFLKNLPVMGFGGRSICLIYVSPIRFLFGVVKQFCRSAVYTIIHNMNLLPESLEQFSQKINEMCVM